MIIPDSILNDPDYQVLVTISGPVHNDILVNGTFTDTDIIYNFPVLKGTKYSDGKNNRDGHSWNWPTLKESFLPCLAEGRYIDYYNNRCEVLLNSTLTKKMFREHSLFLLKESLKVFFPYSANAKKLLEKLEIIDKPFNLRRFLDSQDNDGIYYGLSNYNNALQEIKAGHKKTHWMWYIFPQMKGLGKSQMSDFYGINGREEAKAYMEHPVLSHRLIEATQAVLDSGYSAYDIFGQDTIKFRSCVLLFSTVSDNPIFKRVIKEYKW